MGVGRPEKGCGTSAGEFLFFHPSPTLPSPRSAPARKGVSRCCWEVRVHRPFHSAALGAAVRRWLIAAFSAVCSQTLTLVFASPLSLPTCCRWCLFV